MGHAKTPFPGGARRVARGAKNLLNSNLIDSCSICLAVNLLIMFVILATRYPLPATRHKL
jgi:hypothetical protein